MFSRYPLLYALNIYIFWVTTTFFPYFSNYGIEKWELTLHFHTKLAFNLKEICQVIQFTHLSIPD